jgi:hypothetical protein
LECVEEKGRKLNKMCEKKFIWVWINKAVKRGEGSPRQATQPVILTGNQETEKRAKWRGAMKGVQEDPREAGSQAIIHIYGTIIS